MCDYSLKSIATRPAVVGERLITRNFGTGTIGFAPQGISDPVAICLLPGTEIAFDAPIRVSTGPRDTREAPVPHSVAIFRQVNKEELYTHHDSLELPDGRMCHLAALVAGQTATILQLPAAPKTVEEAAAQKRIEFAG